MGELNYTIIAKASLSGNMIQTVKAKQGDQQSRFVKTTILKDAQEPYIIPDGITAVSYTHLDVYKRQSWDR